MKTVIMIANAFPPEGAAGVFRPLRFTQHLPELGWRPYVVAAEQDSYERYDPALLDMIPTDVEIVRVHGHDPWQAFQAWRARRNKSELLRLDGGGPPLDPTARRLSISSIFHKVLPTIEAWSYHPDRSMFWIRPAVAAAVKLCSRTRANAIWATAGPVSSFIVAQRTSIETGVPYVMDFRDSWTVSYNDFEARRPVWAIRRDRYNMHRLLARAQAVTFRYHSEAECFWRVYPGALDVSRIHIIPNGYDGRINDFNPPKGKQCKVLYAGTLTTYRYDTFLKALHSLKQTSPDVAKRLHFRFIGEGTETLAKEAASLGLTDIVSTTGPIPQENVAQLCRGAHALLVLARPSTMAGHELMAGAKLFAYLKEGKPIVGVLPEGESRNVLVNIGTSTIADVESPSEIISVFRRLVDAWSRGKLLDLAPHRASCEAYSSAQQTTALVRALNGEPPANPFMPGSVEIPLSLRGEITGRCR